MQASSRLQQARIFPFGLRLLVPTIADMMFFILFYMLTFGAWGPTLLNEADTGWHIRNGEHVLNTLSVPYTDTFSYTMNGQPWYAWEWFYDLVLWCIHARFGLNGVVIFSALIIALTFTLLFRWTMARGGQLLVVQGLVLVSVGASANHLLARPHLLTWLFTVVWFHILERLHSGSRSALLWLLAIMLVWINVDGGFLIGLILLALYGAGYLWTYFTTSNLQQSRQALKSAQWFGTCTALCLLVTFANPYGYKLHAHIYQYLSNPFLMNDIAEFLTPNFHRSTEKYFGILLMLVILGATLAPGKLRAGDILVILFSVYSALFAARNLPIASILLTLILAPWLSDIITRIASPTELALWFRRLFSRIEAFSERMRLVECRSTSHALPVLLVTVTLWIALNGGMLFSDNVLSMQFDTKRFPVHAAEFIAKEEIHDRLFAVDMWGGYLVYRLYPRLKLFIDDRHDFYGEPFLRDYLKILSVDLGWKTVLDKYQVQWILSAPDSPLSNTLKEMPDWKIRYDDGVAILFARGNTGWASPRTPSENSEREKIFPK